MKAFRVWDFKYTGKPQSITLKKGNYLFECWGASGTVYLLQETNNGCDETHGRGGYAKGFIQLNKTTTFYVFVGETGTPRPFLLYETRVHAISMFFSIQT